MHHNKFIEDTKRYCKWSPMIASILVVLIELLYVQQIPRLSFSIKTILVGIITIALLYIMTISSRNRIIPNKKLTIFPALLLLLLIFWAGLASVLTAINYASATFIFLAFWFYYYKISKIERVSRTKLYMYLSLGIVIASFVINIIHLIWFPLTKQFAGLFGNPNGYARFLVFALCGSIYVIDRCWRKSWMVKGLLIFAAGLTLAMQFFTNSRAGIIVSILALVVYFVYCLVYKRVGNFFVHTICIVIVSIGIVVLLSTISGMRSEINPFSDRSAEGAVGVNATNSDKILESSKSILDETLQFHKQRAQYSMTTIEAFFTRRLAIYRAYLGSINLFGHSPYVQAEFHSNNKLPGSTAHNAILEVSYDLGWPAGLIFLVLIAYSGIKTIFLLFSKRIQAEEILLPLLTIACYSIYSIVESAYLPSSLAVWYVWASQGHMFNQLDALKVKT